MTAWRWKIATLTAVGPLVVLPLAAAAAAPSHAPGRGASTVHELIYVANADAGPVTAYKAGSRGAIQPVRTVLAPNDDNAFWDPWTVTFDATGHLFVQTFLSDATSVVFRPGAHGTVAPLRKFMGIGPDARGIAVDSHGYEYVTGSDTGTFLVVEPPNASGKPANLYEVPPVRSILLDDPWNPWPSDLAVDSANEVLVVASRPQGNAIEVFKGGAHGGSSPVRVITGPRTGLGTCGSVCDLVIAFSRLTGRILVGVTDGAKTHISVFAANASGDARPLRTVEGLATGLVGKAITGIAGSRCTGTIYAMVHNSGTDFTPARIDAFAANARGDARPLRSFTDLRSRFVDAEGLTITACMAR